MKISSDLKPAQTPVITRAVMQHIIQQLSAAVDDTNCTKGGEYSGEANALRNFEDLSADLDIPPEKVLLVLLTKHMNSIRSYVRQLAKHLDEKDQMVSDLPTLAEPITGRVLDACTYLALFLGMCHRRDLQQQQLNGEVKDVPRLQVTLRAVEDVGMMHTVLAAGESKAFDVPLGSLEYYEIDKLMSESRLVLVTQAQVTREPAETWVDTGNAERRNGIPINVNAVEQEPLTSAHATYGMFIVVDVPQGVNDPQVLFRVVAATSIPNKIVVAADATGQLRALNLDVVRVTRYSKPTPNSPLPVYGAQYKLGELLELISRGTCMDVTAVLAHPEHGTTRHHVDLDTLVNEINGR